MLMSGSEELQIGVLQPMHKEQSNNLYSFNLLVYNVSKWSGTL